MSNSAVNPVTISQFSAYIKQMLTKYCPNQFWICGEIYSMSVRGGHCYIDLVEKATNSDDLVARIRCNIWRWNWEKISAKFYDEIGENIRTGLNVQLLVQADYHGLYSMSVAASDIEPKFTLGELQRRRLQVISELREAGLLDKNKLLTIPRLCRRIAVISSESAAGYTDFCHQLSNNPYGFQYSVTLFSSLMQGKQAEQSLCEALDRVAARAADFDVLVIIRGGGANSDLYVFDSKPVSIKCASFPLPILSGIGHQRDLSIVDMVAHTSLKTPTAVADFLISCHKKLADLLDASALRLSQAVLLQLKVAHSALDVFKTRLPLASVSALKSERHRLMTLMSDMRLGVVRLVAHNRSLLTRYALNLHSDTKHLFVDVRSRLDMAHRALAPSVGAVIVNHKQRLELNATKIKLLDPHILLEKGYSFTMFNGVIITDIAQLHRGDSIVTVLSNGKVESVVEKLID